VSEPRSLDPDERAALEDQRDFLLASLDDLEREHAAGDVDEHDYIELRDDYTARAARVIRTIEAHEVRRAEPRRSSSSRRPLLVGAGVMAFVLLAGVLVALAAGRRDPGENATGNIRASDSDTASQLLAEARGLAAERRLDDAIMAYDRVLEVDPDNVEAMTYKGWMQLQSGNQQGVVTLVEAAELDPEYPDVHFFLAWSFAQLGRDDTALASLDRLDQLDPPPELARLADDLRAELTATR
jgi:tetratricopeptide (TPR) repeat protein